MNGCPWRQEAAWPNLTVNSLVCAKGDASPKRLDLAGGATQNPECRATVAFAPRPNPEGALFAPMAVRALKPYDRRAAAFGLSRQEPAALRDSRHSFENPR